MFVDGSCVSVYILLPNLCRDPSLSEPLSTCTSCVTGTSVVFYDFSFFKVSLWLKCLGTDLQ